MADIDIKVFEKSIQVRPLRMSDYECIVQLQLKCFPGMLPWSREQFESQIRIFPEGQMGVEYQNKIVASSSCLVLDFSLYSDWHSWKEITEGGFITNHDPKGDTLYGIEIMVDPEYRGLKLARRLYNARKELARQMNLMRIILGGRIPGYGRHADRMTAREYVDKVTNKILVDPVLTPQISNGFILKRLIPNYLTSDEASRGYATFLEWTNLDYLPEKGRIHTTAWPVRICAVQYQMRMVKDFDAFAHGCEYFVDVASDYRCDFIVFPEIFTTQLLSFLPPDRPAMAMRRLSEFTTNFLELFSGLAIKYNVNIIGGSHFTIEDENLYNISYLFCRDGSIDKQYKLHITPNERKWWGVKPGHELKVFDTDMGRICIQICYDVEFPELSRIAAEQGAQIIFVPFCTDERYAYLRVRYCAQARCIENHMYAVIAGSCGNLPFVENLDVHYAQSAIFTPSDIPFTRDAILSEATPNIETVIVDEVDLHLLRKHRQTGSVLNWLDRRQDLYEIKVRTHDKPTPPVSAIQS